MSGYKTFFIEDERETNSQVSINGQVVISLLGCGILQGGGRATGQGNRACTKQPWWVSRELSFTLKSTSKGYILCDSIHRTLLK